MSRTTKPCPGCGEVDRYRVANAVCGNCRRDLDAWKQHVASLGKLDAQTEIVELSEVDYAWPGFYNGAHGHGLENFETHQAGLQKGMHAVAYRLAKAVYPKNQGPEDSWKAKPLFMRPSYDYPLGEHMHGWFNTDALFAKTDIDLFRTLYDHIAQFAHLCYLSGVRDGQNILVGLANGTLDLERLEEKHKNLAEAVQKANSSKPYSRKRAAR